MVLITCPPPTPHISQFMLLFCFHSSEKRVRKFSLRVEKRILLLIVFLLKKKKKEKGIPPSLSINTRKEENHGASLARPLAVASVGVGSVPTSQLSFQPGGRWWPIN